MLKTLILPSVLALSLQATAQNFKVVTNTSQEPIAAGAFQPSIEGLSGYECPEWFRDAKFGIWAHWGVQCAPECGDWYARGMYQEGKWQYNYQYDVMGHPSEYGMKDWIPLWKAERWQPEELVKFYKESGARYFFAMANHHDNFDNYDSKYQPWNSVNMGPRRDIIGEWAKAAHNAGLPFGVSIHAAHAWTFYETSRSADTTGIYKGVSYDGHLTKADGKGKWWEGYDPQDLYEQRHTLSKDSRKWNWDEGLVTTPDQQYCDRIYNRSVDLINKYNPDLVYYDDTFMPLWPVSDAGLKITAHLYNHNAAQHGGKNQAVAFGKVLTAEQKKTITWDVEKGVPDDIQPLPWQTCTCIGSWHYDKHRFLKNNYKSAKTVVQMMADIVSKNGNLLLSVPVKGDGTIDKTERQNVARIGEWLKVNGEAIYGTRPWTVFGEGPASKVVNKMTDQGFNEGKVKFTSRDMRFTRKGRCIYVIFMGQPTEDITIESLGLNGLAKGNKVRAVELLGGTGKTQWKQTKTGLQITLTEQAPLSEAAVYKVTLAKTVK